MTPLSTYEALRASAAYGDFRNEVPWTYAYARKLR
jgi:hypothetical protein